MGDLRVKRGKAAEYLFIAQCFLRGIACFVPLTEDGRIDVLVGDKLLRCQVKALGSKTMTGTKSLPLRKTGANSKSNVKIHKYTSAEVDIMVGVDLDTFECYIVPLKEIEEEYSNSISIPVLTARGYKDNFEVLL